MFNRTPEFRLVGKPLPLEALPSINVFHAPIDDVRERLATTHALRREASGGDCGLGAFR
jgi:hypothetical protein